VRRTILAVFAATLTFLAVPPSSAAPANGSVPSAYAADPVVTNLDFPAAFTFAPDGRIFYGERLDGDIRVYNPSNQANTLFFHVPNLLGDGERGVLGLALHPRYPAKPYLFAYVTRDIGGVPTNQIIRLTEQGGVGVNMLVVFQSNVVSDLRHNGGRILFGPDKKLYVVIGDAANAPNAQDLSKNAGKILRMTTTGNIPFDNPIPGSYVYSFGHRNSYGFAFDPRTGKLWETENGPACNDEINVSLPGENYGWGADWTCSTPPTPPVNTNRDGSGPILPEFWYTPTIAPTGAVFCEACGLVSGSGRMFFGAVNTGDIRRVILTVDRTHGLRAEVVYHHPDGILSMERGPDGRLYFSSFGGIYVLINA
jgi:glucose/arabinose dehydrogenase